MQTRTPPLGVIFDLDGVLVSTDHLHFMAWKELADKLELAFDENVNHQLRGVSRSASLQIIFAHNQRPLPPDDVFTNLCDAKNQRYLELVNTLNPSNVLPGARELLAELRSAGCGTAVASASRNAKIVLERIDLLNAVDTVVDGNDIKHPKPDPEAYLLAADKLGIPAKKCIGIEDAEAGITSILAAGMPAIFVGPHPLNNIVHVKNLRELNVAKLQLIYESAIN